MIEAAVGGAGAGAALVIAGITARVRSRTRTRHRLVRVLHDPDPAVRRGGVQALAAAGIGRYGELLLALRQRETDPGVLDELSRTVQQNQWEPIGSPTAMELRIWAASRQAARPADTPPLVVELPKRQPGPAAALRRPLRSAVSAVGSAAGPVVGSVVGPARDVLPGPSSARHHLRAPAPRTSPPASPQGPEPAGPTRVLRVLVTGAGGPAAVSVEQALRRDGHHIFAVDSDPHAAGFGLSDSSAVVPPFTDPQYVPQLAALAARAEVSVLIPTLAEELVALRRGAALMAEAGVAMWLPPEGSVGACVDKWLFAQSAHALGLPVPATALGFDPTVPGPWIVKPRSGRGSRDVYRADDVEELRYALARVASPLVQTRLEGQEFTVDVLTDRVGTVLVAVPRWRLETRGGISVQGETFQHERLEVLVRRLIEGLALVGAANVQGFVGDDGSVSFTEVNPRFSGGLPLSLAAGADLVGQYVQIALGEPADPQRLGWRPGVRMSRHFTEVITWPAP